MPKARVAGPESQAESAAPPAATQVLSLLIAVLGGIYLAARPLAGQFSVFSAENAFVGLVAVLLALAAGALAIHRKIHMPGALTSVALLWFGMFFWGACRSPNPGAAIPLATDAAFYMAMLICGYFAGRANPALRGIFIRAIIAVAAVEAVCALWQIYIDLPRMRQQFESGELSLLDDLKSRMGLDRFYGDNAFGTFVNPNSLAGFLIAGFFLLAGHAWDSFFAPRPVKKSGLALNVFNLLLGAVLLFALYWTGSKGGAIALVCGLWFFALQRLNGRYLFLNKVTAAGVGVVVLLLILGVAGIVPARLYGLSMQVRFEYWKAALAMFARHPFDGVGLGGYAEWQTFFKTPLGWETKDPHNEYLCLLAEFGVLGPLIYAATWWLIFRRSDGAKAAGVAADPSSGARASRLLELLTIVGGAFALLFSIAQFGVFNAIDVAKWFNGDTSKQTAVATLQTLGLPLIFALVAWLLRVDAMAAWRSGGADHGSSPALLHGYRAAAGAVLMHQLVDFDFKVQALMAALLLCGGLFWGSADEEGTRKEGSRSNLEKYSAWLLPLCAVLLFPTAVWIQYAAGAPRADAEYHDEIARTIAEHPEKADPGETLDQHYSAILYTRKQAADAAPFDSDAVTELALAKARYDTRSDRSDEEILGLLRRAEALRPYSAKPKALIAGFYFRRALALRRQGLDAEARTDFQRAHAAYLEARARYPLNPGLSLMAGDPLLFLGEAEKASEVFLQAFTTDIAINDPYICISAIFTDPRPSVFARHNSDHTILSELSGMLAKGQGAAKEGTRTRMGLLVRRMLALARVLRDQEESGVSSKEAARGSESLQRELRYTVEELRELAHGLPEQAHAALLLALCLRKTGPLEQTPEGKAQWEKDCREADEIARKLQRESVEGGTPGTAPLVFEAMIRRRL